MRYICTAQKLLAEEKEITDEWDAELQDIRKQLLATQPSSPLPLNATGA